MLQLVSNIIDLVGEEPPTCQSTNLAPSANNLAPSSNTSASTNLSAILNNTTFNYPSASSTTEFRATTVRGRVMSHTQQAAATRNPMMRGQGFSHSETSALLDLVASHLPISARDRENIAMSHLVYYPKSR